MDDRIGTEFSGFRVNAEISRGEMGVVYLAEQASLRRKVASRTARCSDFAHRAASAPALDQALINSRTGRSTGPLSKPRTSRTPQGMGDPLKRFDAGASASAHPSLP